MEETRTSTPLLVISSRTGNTMILGHAICDALPGAKLVKPADLPEDLSGYNPVLLGFWCDRGNAPEEMLAIAPRFEGKTIGCFATMGGDADSPESKAWMQRTAEGLINAGKGNTLAGTFLCRGRIDPELFKRMTDMMGGVVSEEREARRRASETHPDRLDLQKGAELFRSVFGMNF
ncbi:flavodoxin family protein [Sutterella sp.]|uniref:flavodoxin family protein n=1 Tax=Sutterella sp. TaxID=1981025 RepID=UPI0026E04B0F|nr:flavodoxin family protein [Sutterella sp.]MDO5532242.1 flavodoxin family protein [Sutterella sp.]